MNSEGKGRNDESVVEAHGKERKGLNEWEGEGEEGHPPCF